MSYTLEYESVHKIFSIQLRHYIDVIMGTIASQITSLTIVYLTVYSDTDQRKHQSSASLAFVQGIHRGPVNSPHKWPVTRKMFPFDDVIMEFEGGGPGIFFICGWHIRVKIILLSELHEYSTYLVHLVIFRFRHFQGTCINNVNFNIHCWLQLHSKRIPWNEIHSGMHK